MVKSFKGYVSKVCMVRVGCRSGVPDPSPSLHSFPAQEENGHVVMMGLFDCVDDTVLVTKALLSVSHIIPCSPCCMATMSEDSHWILLPSGDGC